MKRDIIYKLKNNFITKFIASNNYIMIALMISPLLIYIAFGTTFYEAYDENIQTGTFGLPEEGNEEFYKYNGTPLMGDDLKPDKIEKNITAKDEYVFRNTFMASMIQVAKISFLIGGAISALTWGSMTEEGSIVHLIFSKKSREIAFIHLFSFPLIFVVFISLTSSLAISSEILNFYPGRSIMSLFLLSSLLVGGTMFVGYVFSSVLSLLSKNTFLPILGTLLILGSTFVFPSKRTLVMPFESIVRHIKFGHPIADASKVGIVLIALAVIGSYIIFKRRSYY